MNNNVQHCLEWLLPPILTPGEKFVIAREALRLFGLLSTSITQYFDELSLLKAALFQESNNVVQKAQVDVYQSLINQKVITEYALCAFTACDLQKQCISQEMFDYIKAVFLFCCCRLLVIGNHEASIKSVCTEIRMLALGNRNTLIPFLPDSHLNLEELNIFFTAKLDGSELNSSVCNQLKNLLLPITKILEQRNGYKRKYAPREFKEHSILRTTKIEAPFDDSSIMQIRQLNLSSNQHNTWKDEEEDSGQNRTLHIITIPQSQEMSYSQQAIQAKAISNNYLKQNMYLPCNIYLCSNHEISILLNELYSELKSNLKNAVVQATLLMLLTGSNLSCVKKIKFKKMGKSLYAINREYKLPSQRLPKNINRYLSSVSQKFILPLPSFVSSINPSSLIKDLDNDDITKYLSLLNKKHGTHFSLSKVRNILHAQFKRQNEDPLYTALISQQSTHDWPQLSYSQINQQTILQKYFQFTTWLSHTSNCSVFHNFDVQNRFILDEMNTELGSPMGGIDHCIKIIFELLEKEIYATTSINNLHNLITMRVQIVLALCSGYRPVRAWLGHIGDIDLNTGQYWISDKENQIGDVSRIIVLPQQATKEVTQYIEYLKAVDKTYTSRKDDTRLRFKQAINTRSPLFFYIKQAQILDCNPKQIEEIYKNIFPVPLNWHRHFLRSYLSNSLIDPELIDAWMGHSKNNEKPFSRHSSLTIKELEHVSIHIQKLMDSFKLKDLDYAAIFRSSIKKNK